MLLPLSTAPMSGMVPTPNEKDRLFKSPPGGMLDSVSGPSSSSLESSSSNAIGSGRGNLFRLLLLGGEQKDAEKDHEQAQDEH